MSEEQFNINDLTIKIQVLSKGLIDERQKSQNYLNKIKEFEEMISQKDLEIVTLNKEKFDLHTTLLAEQKLDNKTKAEAAINDVVNKVFDINAKEYDEFEKVKETNNQLKAQRKDLTTKLVHAHELFDQQRMKFDTLITIQETQLISVRKAIEHAKAEKKAIEERFALQGHLIKNFESEKQIYEDQLQQIAKISIENDNKKIANLTEIEELKKQQLKPKQDKIKELQERIKSRLDELAYQRKNAIAIEQEEFMVIKEESFVKKTKVNVIFRQNKQSKYFELIIKSAEKEQKDMEVLYFVKVKEYKKFEKKKFRFEYLQSDNDKNKVFVFDMDILLIDYFYDKFHEFYRTAKNYHIDM